MRHTLAVLVISLCVIMSACNSKLNQVVIKEEDIESVQVVGGLPGTEPSPLYTKKAQISKIVSWINASRPVSGETTFGKHGYPMVANLKTKDGRTIVVEPAYHCVFGNSSKNCTPVKDEIVLSLDSNKMRVESSELYHWLKDGWKTELE